MRDGDGGAIVNITSVHEHIPRPGFAVYVGQGGALGMLTRSFALELRARRHSSHRRRAGRHRDAAKREGRTSSHQIPLGRPGDPAEVAALVSYLVSGEAHYVSGTSVIIDGAMPQQVVAQPAW